MKSLFRNKFYVGYSTQPRRLRQRAHGRAVNARHENHDVVLDGLPTWRGSDALAAVTGGADVLAPTTLINPSPEQVADGLHVGVGRLHRIGQESAVTAWYLLAPDTIDETMAELLERKRGLIDAVTDGQVRDDERLVEAVVRELRGRPFRHLRVVA